MNRQIEEHLFYVIPKMREPLSTSIFDAEVLHNALLVQPLIGNLIKYSNDGRFSPYIADRWEQFNPKTWIFYLQKGLKTEDNELITAESFKLSLLRSLRWMSQHGHVPIFENLVNYKTAVATNQWDKIGIIASGNQLEFHFSKPTRSGLLEFLAMAPFGFIASNNFSGNTWKDKTKFISSGAYKLNSHNPGTEYTIERRTFLIDKKTSSTPPKFVTFISHESSIPNKIHSPNVIFDLVSAHDLDQNTFTKISKIPENLHPVIIPLRKDGFFSKKSNRYILRKKIKEINNRKNVTNEGSYKAENFYSSSFSIPHDDFQYPATIPKPDKTLLIRGGIAPLSYNRRYVKSVLSEALDELLWQYEFDESSFSSYSEVFDEKYDLDMFNSSEIGSAPEGWGIQMLFCSLIGPQYPDPTTQICSIAEKFEAGVLGMKEFSRKFNEYIYEDSCVIPVLRSGRTWYASNRIDLSSLSPVVSIPRFEEINLLTSND